MLSWYETPTDYADKDIYAFGTIQFTVELPGITDPAEYCSGDSYQHSLYVQTGVSSDEQPFINNSSTKEEF